MIRKQLVQFTNPILSMLVLTLGNGLYTTVTSLELKAMQMSPMVVGLISASYFVGLMVGPLLTQKTIVRVGHIRAYSVFASIMTAAMLLQGIFQVPWLWAFLRFLAGYALAGLFICIESWLLAASDRETKGRVLAFYMISFFTAQAVSQLLLKVPFSTYMLVFAFTGTLACISILPVALTRFAAPAPEEMELTSPRELWQKVPLGLLASFIGGMVMAVVYTMYPVVLSQIGLERKDVALVMFITILGGAILQIPIGKFSDNIDRRQVILAVCASVVLLAILGMIWHGSLLKLSIISFFIGGFSFAIYPLAISHTGDYIRREATVSAITLLTVVYGFGSIVGPLALPMYLYWHVSGFFAFMLTICAILGSYTGWRIIVRSAVPVEEQASFVSAQPEANIAQEQLAEQLDVYEQERE